ncbi:hypothetical protein BKA64DRAFT_649909 [Cadophora sp. MPI-SDFR-AT-0126]|nr:hypothetical protein BKA64DRAFT_649909 [Leotiomycetes sp. MPI-SDFR-AT-0126]
MPSRHFLNFIASLLRVLFAVKRWAFGLQSLIRRVMYSHQFVLTRWPNTRCLPAISKNAGCMNDEVFFPCMKNYDAHRIVESSRVKGWGINLA